MFRILRVSIYTFEQNDVAVVKLWYGDAGVNHTAEPVRAARRERLCVIDFFTGSHLCRRTLILFCDVFFLNYALSQKGILPFLSFSGQVTSSVRARLRICLAPATTWDADRLRCAPRRYPIPDRTARGAGTAPSERPSTCPCGSPAWNCLRETPSRGIGGGGCPMPHLPMQAVV